MRHIGRTSRPHGAVEAENFVTPGLMQRMLGRDEGLPVRLYRVTFGEGGRTHWHEHDDVQVLFGLSGRCVVEDRSGQRLHLNPGDVVVIEPGEQHWHGAAPGTDGEHLAINLGSDTRWLESTDIQAEDDVRR